MKIIYIHGAGASAFSFNYIRLHMNPMYEEIFLEYSTEKSFSENLDAMISTIERDHPGPDEFIIVAHSLGGIYALHLEMALGDELKGIVTMSTPFGGIEVADWLKYWFPVQIYHDIGPSAFPIAYTKNLDIKIPFTILVTTGGKTPLIPGPNDGVVSERSMTAREGTMAKHINVPVNHFEVLMHPAAVGAVSDMLYQLEKNTNDPTR